jgi:hypothetical protein
VELRDLAVVRKMRHEVADAAERERLWKPPWRLSAVFEYQTRTNFGDLIFMEPVS